MTFWLQSDIGFQLWRPNKQFTFENTAQNEIRTFINLVTRSYLRSCKIIYSYIKSYTYKLVIFTTIIRPTRPEIRTVRRREVAFLKHFLWPFSFWWRICISFRKFSLHCWQAKGNRYWSCFIQSTCSDFYSIRNFTSKSKANFKK